MKNDVSFDVPRILQALNIEVRGRNTNVICPYCGKKKAYINTVSGLWDCKAASCEGSDGGNIVSFYAAKTGQDRKQAFKALINGNYAVDLSRQVEAPIIEAENVPRRDIREIDEVYRAFLRLLTLKSTHKENLLRRGHSEKAIQKCMYRSCPSDYKESFPICKALVEDMGYNLVGIPGFFQAKNGSWMFKCISGIFVPQFNEQHLIFGLQLRKDEIKGEDDSKYIWFSSSNKAGGTGVKTYVHYACDFRKYTNGKLFPYMPNHKVILTEGGMKANIIHDLQPTWSVISVPGVNAISNLETALKYLRIIGVTDVVLCYDMDYQTNKNVAKALEKTRDCILRNGLKYHFGEWNTKTDEGVDRLKGLDDFLAYKLKGI